MDYKRSAFFTLVCEIFTLSYLIRCLQLFLRLRWSTSNSSVVIGCAQLRFFPIRCVLLPLLLRDVENFPFVSGFQFFSGKKFIRSDNGWFLVEGREERLYSIQTIGVYLDFQNPIDQLFRENRKTSHISLFPNHCFSSPPLILCGSTHLHSLFTLMHGCWNRLGNKVQKRICKISSLSTHISLPTILCLLLPSIYIKVSDLQRVLFYLPLRCNKLLIRHHLRMGALRLAAPWKFLSSNTTVSRKWWGWRWEDILDRFSF